MMTDLNEELLLIENEMIWIGNDYMTMMILLLIILIDIILVLFCTIIIIDDIGENSIVVLTIWNCYMTY